MASRIIAQMIISGVQIVSRAVITAYQQALRSTNTINFVYYFYFIDDSYF